MSESDPNSATIPATGAPSADERQWAMFAHLSSLLGALLTIPLMLAIGITSLVFCHHRGHQAARGRALSLSGIAATRAASPATATPALIQCRSTK